MKISKRIVLGGEGPNELGGWFHAIPFRDETPHPGVLEELLRKIQPEGWHVVDGVIWKNIRKYQAGKHADAEQRCVLGLVLHARERGADAVAFARDCDGDEPHHRERAASVDAGITRAREVFTAGPAVIGGVAVRMLESWILALAGERGSEALGRKGLATACERHGLREKHTGDMVERVQRADLAALPDDARSLRRWIDQARVALDGP